MTIMSDDFFIRKKGKAIKYLYILLVHLYFRPKNYLYLRIF